ncbi:hypothetical protein P3T37_000345 [Kitasatospora sp. MAA4]|nr:hypothetical protein [Kitasatospora sp. MAA4]
MPSSTPRAGESLAETYPHVAAEWHPDNILLPSQVKPKSSKKVRWLCRFDEGHTWETTPAARTSGGTNCPLCAFSGRSRIEVELAHEIDYLLGCGVETSEVTGAAQSWDCDVVIHARRVIVEYDGYRYHRSAEAQERDHRKIHDLTASGWIVVRVREHGLAQIDSQNVMLPQYARTKAIADAVLNRIADLTGPIDGLGNYLNATEAKRTQEAAEWILRERAALRSQWINMVRLTGSYFAKHSRLPQKGHILASGHAIGAWVAKQRSDFARRRLAPWQVEMLNGMPGWEWNGYPGFNVMLQALTSWTEEAGVASPSKDTMQDGLPIGPWAAQQRTRYKRGTLKEDRRQRLEALPGWSWFPRSDEWERKLRLARLHVIHCGDMNMRSDHVCDNGEPLGLWVGYLRTRYRVAKLTSQQIHEVEVLPGWTWSPDGERRAQMVALLRAFEAENGHARVPYHYRTDDGTQLGIWVSDQRKLHSARIMPRSDRLQLESLSGWTWSVPDAIWEEYVAAMLEFSDANGHCRATRTQELHGLPIGEWLAKQRASVKSGKISADRKARLESLPGWTLNVFDQAWEIWFSLLEGYMQKHGGAVPPESYVTLDGRRLGLWVREQKKLMREGRQRADRRLRLDPLLD